LRLNHAPSAVQQKVPEPRPRGEGEQRRTALWDPEEARNRASITGEVTQLLSEIDEEDLEKIKKLHGEKPSIGGWDEIKEILGDIREPRLGNLMQEMQRADLRDEVKERERPFWSSKEPGFIEGASRPSGRDKGSPMSKEDGMSGKVPSWCKEG
jgi:hypothetical protein